jgi:hypothetical protein
MAEERSAEAMLANTPPNGIIQLCCAPSGRSYWDSPAKQFDIVVMPSKDRIPLIRIEGALERVGVFRLLREAGGGVSAEASAGTRHGYILESGADGTVQIIGDQGLWDLHELLQIQTYNQACLDDPAARP